MEYGNTEIQQYGNTRIRECGFVGVIDFWWIAGPSTLGPSWINLYPTLHFDRRIRHSLEYTYIKTQEYANMETHNTDMWEYSMATIEQC